MKVIKIDVEGGESGVIDGGRDFFNTYLNYIVMEYLSAERGNSSHIKAQDILHQMGYRAFTISNSGQLIACHSIDDHLSKEKIDSDNIVFRKE